MDSTDDDRAGNVESVRYWGGVPFRRWPSVFRRGIVFASFWWVLVAGETASWWIGAPAVMLASILSVALLPPVTLVWHALPGFIPFFLFRSLLGGADVAWRAIHPRMPISPHLVEYPIRLPPGLPQVFMVNIVSLLPGTLSAELSSQVLRVHVLSGRGDVASELEALERRVAGMFGASLPARSGT